ncbi:MAG: outer membrane protein assembly factor BamD [Bacteriovoracales bacterium]|nr:outer membrane protein assembly factor BamD [Bacteriovoracales bacterium]
MKLKPTLLLLIIALLSSCATEAPKGRTFAEGLYREAEDLAKDKRYLMAIEKLGLLRSRYPYSFYATQAELLLADIYFLQENYEQAAQAYIFFKDFHPKHKKTSYIISKIAESFFRQLPKTFDRDLSLGRLAVQYYREVVQKYGRTKYAKSAKEKIALLEKMFDQKEKYIADFYFKTKVYMAAKYRYDQMLKTVKDNRIRFHAMERVIESSYLLEEYEKCAFYINRYFSKLDRSAKARLQKTRDRCLSKKLRKSG